MDVEQPQEDEIKGAQNGLQNQYNELMQKYDSAIREIKLLKYKDQRRNQEKIQIIRDVKLVFTERFFKNHNNILELVESLENPKQMNLVDSKIEINWLISHIKLTVLNLFPKVGCVMLDIKKSIDEYNCEILLFLRSDFLRFLIKKLFYNRRKNKEFRKVGRKFDQKRVY